MKVFVERAPKFSKRPAGRIFCQFMVSCGFLQGSFCQIFLSDLFGFLSEVLLDISSEVLSDLLEDSVRLV